jgi:hypothetical protein
LKTLLPSSTIFNPAFLVRTVPHSRPIIRVNVIIRPFLFWEKPRRTYESYGVFEVNAYMDMRPYAVIGVNIPTGIYLQNLEFYPHEKS